MYLPQHLNRQTEEGKKCIIQTISMHTIWLSPNEKQRDHCANMQQVHRSKSVEKKTEEEKIFAQKLIRCRLHLMLSPCIHMLPLTLTHAPPCPYIYYLWAHIHSFSCCNAI